MCDILSTENADFVQRKHFKAQFHGCNMIGLYVKVTNKRSGL